MSTDLRLSTTSPKAPRWGAGDAVFHGEIYYLAAATLFLLVKALHRMAVARRVVLGGLAMLFGYCARLLRRKPRLVTRDEARYYRALLRRRLSGHRAAVACARSDRGGDRPCAASPAYSISRRARRPARLRANDRGAAPPRPGRRRAVPRRRGRAGPSPPVDHRRRWRLAADRQRGRHACRSSSTARSTTSSSCAANSRASGTGSDAVGHRGDRPRVRAMGRGLRRALQRDVRVRAVGRRPPRAVPGARPPRASSRCTTSISAAAGVRLRDQGAAPRSRAARERSTWRRSAELFTFRYVPSPKTLFKGIRKLPPGHSMTARRGAASR